MEPKKALTLLLILCFAVFPKLPFGVVVKAQSVTDLIYIRADGTLEGTDKIQREGNVYTLTDDIFNQSILFRAVTLCLTAQVTPFKDLVPQSNT